ncbi:DEAD/DEAH box helicase family protein [Dehalococcoides mccartyi]|uniref:DEAD/DEAH box helicase family protein n=1 Tax=Dehalococcoides mccartyi TaxID=61435 RepID=UPI0007506A02|nr:DEAD/DEAH box helicase family protein [Dehalococcoides mccartyi]
MAKAKNKGLKAHNFRNKLLLNQWLVSLFGIDPLSDKYQGASAPKPFHDMVEPLRECPEGMDHDNLHHFYHALVDSNLFWNDICALSKAQILAYEENIARHTLVINERRQRPVVWKYYQWLTLLFVEVYLDRFFGDREGLLNSLNEYLGRFNQRWTEYAGVSSYEEDDLNKLCLQNATGSGKTLLMHINLLQYRHYAQKHGRDTELSRVILLTPNERLSEQHLTEFQASSIDASSYLQSRSSMFGQADNLKHVDVLEITKLADQEGPNTIATRSLGDQNLLLVDEGHRGMSGKDEGVWFTRRSDLCAKGFTFEYSATFEQAVKSSGNAAFENSYAKTIIFDYSYRWFYEDGFGKDYQILNLPDSYDEIKSIYLTACLLKFYQQLRIYSEKKKDFEPFNIEKPLWVFVGSTVSSEKMNKDEQAVATDVAQIIQFVANFLDNRKTAERRINEILTGKGQDTGLLDKDNNDIFAGSFDYLIKAMNAGETVESLYQNILVRLFNNGAGGTLTLDRIKGESGEIALRVGTAETPFGLINVGDTKGLCDHIANVAIQNVTRLTVEESDFTEAMFASVKDSSSPVNMLIGSKKFVEGWDCWRVSTMGLMHVGRSEGSQIIQLFGRGVRLKGFDWSLKRSGHTTTANRPNYIEELETLNVFGIEADFMEKFREFLKEEGLPGNERRKIFTIPLNVTYDFGKKLKILRPKRKASDGSEYDFKKDAPVPAVGTIPDYLTHNTIVADWYPRIQTVQSRGIGQATQKDKVMLHESHLALLDYDALFFELERFKRERAWYNINVSKIGIRSLLKNPNWYTLYLPETRLKPTDFNGVRLIQQVATELLKRYCEHYYNYCKREYIEPRLELRELTPEDDNLPQGEYYQLIVDGDEEQLIQGIQKIKKELIDNKDKLLKAGDLNACNLGIHLFQPVFHVRPGGKITILPVSLNESEYQFVTDLKTWYDSRHKTLKKDGMELFLLRNMSRGKGVGFFEAGNFHPDFILWMLVGGKQYVTFIEPHGLLHEGPASEKILFQGHVKEVEKRLHDPDVILNSFILSWTRYPQLKWGNTQKELEDKHVLFMTDDRDHYIDKLFAKLKENIK